MITYKGRTLRVNEDIYRECMRLGHISGSQKYRVYESEKNYLRRLLQPGDTYEDMVSLLCDRIGL